MEKYDLFLSAVCSQEEEIKKKPKQVMERTQKPIVMLSVFASDR